MVRPMHGVRPAHHRVISYNKIFSEIYARVGLILVVRMYYMIEWIACIVWILCIEVWCLSLGVEYRRSAHTRRSRK